MCRFVQHTKRTNAERTNQKKTQTFHVLSICVYYFCFLRFRVDFCASEIESQRKKEKKGNNNNNKKLFPLGKSPFSSSINPIGSVKILLFRKLLKMKQKRSPSHG